MVGTERKLNNKFLDKAIKETGNEGLGVHYKKIRCIVASERDSRRYEHSVLTDNGNVTTQSEGKLQWLKDSFQKLNKVSRSMKSSLETKKKEC